MQNQRGFTLLELIVTIGIVAVVFTVAATSGLGDWGKKKGSINITKFINDELATIKNQALSQNTTTRMVITQSGTDYSMSTYYSAAPTTTCTSSGAWATILNAVPIDVDPNYEITGSGMAGTCFYRDGSASGGTFTIAPVTGATGVTYDLDVSIATGYLSVTHD